MKKFLALVLCLTLVLTCFTALFGCGGDESGDTQSGNSISDNDSGDTQSGNSVSDNDSGGAQDGVLETVDPIIVDNKIFNLKEAYETGIIDKEDLLNIAYRNGDYEVNKDSFPVDFTPAETDRLANIDNTRIVEGLAIIYNSLKLKSEEFDDGTAEIFAGYFTVKEYLGKYNDYYVIKFSSWVLSVVLGYEYDILVEHYLWDYEELKNIDGLSFSQSDYAICLVKLEPLVLNINYNADIYYSPYKQSWIDITGTYGEYHDAEVRGEEWYDRVSPKTRLYELTEETALDEIFEIVPDINLKNQTCIIYCFTGVYGAYRLVSTYLDEENNLIIEFEGDTIPGYGSASLPFTKRLLFIMDKVEYNDVIIKEL